MYHVINLPTEITITINYEWLKGFIKVTRMRNDTCDLHRKLAKLSRSPRSWCEAMEENMRSARAAVRCTWWDYTEYKIIKIKTLIFCDKCRGLQNSIRQGHCITWQFYHVNFDLYLKIKNSDLEDKCNEIYNAVMKQVFYYLLKLLN